jgi:hypothetical protein
MACWKQSPGIFNFAAPHPRGRRWPSGHPHRGEALEINALIRAFSFIFVFSIILVRPAPSAALEARHEMVVAEGDLAAQAGLGVLKHGHFARAWRD